MAKGSERCRDEGNRGFAAAQCGKASPYRQLGNFLRSEAAPQNSGGVASQIIQLATVRQSLTALCGGRAAASGQCVTTGPPPRMRALPDGRASAPKNLPRRELRHLRALILASIKLLRLSFSVCCATIRTLERSFSPFCRCQLSNFFTGEILLAPFTHYRHSYLRAPN